MNPHQQHRGATFQQVFQCLSREGWFSQWGMSGMSYFKPGTVVGTAVFNQNVFVGEANVEMYWRHSGDWQRVERMIFQAQLNNHMHQNQLNQQRQHHHMQQHMAAAAAAVMPRGIPMPEPPTPSSSTSLPSAAELLDQRNRSLNYPLDMLCDILAVDRDTATPNGPTTATPRQTRQQQQQHLHEHLHHHLPGMHHPMGDPSRFPMLDPSHPSSILFPQSTTLPPTSSTMHLLPSSPSSPPPPLPSSGDLDLVDHPPISSTTPSSDTVIPSATPKPPTRPKKRSRNLYIRLDQMKTVLRKHGWKWVEGPKGFIYCKPHVQVTGRGKSMTGKDGVDFFSGRGPFETYVRSQKSLMELIQNDLKDKHDGAIFSMDIPPEDQLCAPTYKERAELARRKQMKEKRMAALTLRRSLQVAAAATTTTPSSNSTTTSSSAAATTTPSSSTAVTVVAAAPSQGTSAEAGDIDTDVFDVVATTAATAIETETPATTDTTLASEGHQDQERNTSSEDGVPPSNPVELGSSTSSSVVSTTVL
ncbi:hypothetical protein H257_15558 [Aphanomyces astaci]|uniref:Uncharacterized protein n=1 Tax=Aphanomyces astaci TaxID=112090 RepID=W4FNS8_APHAT|nr:hypothetical protein H257_15558 [Aphanomyces astaci]ETV68581.1 hypothetical protein H257_15558 [Aphanomyces astaci]|eukprot:XP_009842010.1 hypothetical protein H257_15558 [Aphanomyces astaci]